MKNLIFAVILLVLALAGVVVRKTYFHVPPRELKNIASSELMRRVTRADDYQQWTKDYLGGA